MSRSRTDRRLLLLLLCRYNADMLAAARPDDASALLAAWRAGDLHARDRLFALFYPELRRAAAAMVRREPGLSMSTGDLIHEAVARLMRLNSIEWQDRAHEHRRVVSDDEGNLHLLSLVTKLPENI